ncbi:hypothetical protein HK100_007310 [Physocladia obscura]|uniref:Uncharacterized protein n=1 Tax=Physocladia obscura TaxID=109957 RepID=A0AAD5SPQ2_9FUNG|nr:hypothetical protein HK100_007310 [Physocladia obscura]
MIKNDNANQSLDVKDASANNNSESLGSSLPIESEKCDASHLPSKQEEPSTTFAPTLPLKITHKNMIKKNYANQTLDIKATSANLHTILSSFPTITIPAIVPAPIGLTVDVFDMFDDSEDPEKYAALYLVLDTLIKSPFVQTPNY